MNKLNLIAVLFSLLIFPVSADKKSDKNKSKQELIKFAEKLTPFKGTQPAQWRISWTGDASREATISWSTAEAGKKHTVYYGEKALGSKVGSYKMKQACQRSGKYSVGKKEKAPAGYYHHAVIKNLKPSTKYFFVMESDGKVSKQLYFITAPDKGTGFSVIHGGDSRSGHLVRCKINEMIAAMVEKDPKIIGFVHGGDYIVSGKSWSQWRLWLSQHELTTCKDGRVLPLIAARGNHDGGPIYKEVFNIGPKQPDWHTTNIGSDIAVVTLDTNVSGGGDQSKWLEGELKRLRPQSKWLLTQYHRPLYPAVKTAPAHAKIFCPLFDKYNVDLACEADGHCIKRTIPIRNGKADPTGVTYIGEGGLGVGQRKTKSNLWYLKGGKVGSQHHVMKLEFTDQKLRITTILLDGKIFDDHTLKARK